MNRAHGVMLKEGPHKLTFGPLVDYDDDKPTRLLVRQGEARGFLLLQSTLNTQGRSHK